MEFNFTKEEIQLLRKVLENDLSDLRMEIADTDRGEFRDKLKIQKATLEKILDKLNTETVH